MNARNSGLMLALTLTLCATGTVGADDSETVVAPATATVAAHATPSSELWKNPEFQKQFLAGSAAASELEPKLSTIEHQQMEKILPLVGSDPATAAAQLEPLVTPASSAAMNFLLGTIYLQLDRLDEAGASYNEAIRKFPNFRRAWKHVGLLRFRQSKTDEAIAGLTKVVELGGADALTYGLLGYSYSGSGQLVAAESAFRNAMLLQPDQLDWKVGLAQTLFRERKYADASAMTEELIAKYPDRAEYWLLQANANLGLNRPLEAAQGLEIVRRLGKISPASLYTLGDIYVNESLWDPAVGAYGEAMEKDKDKQDLTKPMRCVEILSQRGALPQAKALLETIKATAGEGLAESDRKRVLKLQARIAVAEGSTGDAVRVLEEVVALDPLDGEALLLLGQHYAKNGESDKAVFYFERAAGLEPFEADAKVRQAQILVAQAKYAEAIPLLRRAQEVKPRDDVGRYLEQIERAARSRK